MINPLIYLLDSNVCIMHIKGRSPSIDRHLEYLETDKIAVCSVVKAELFYGSLGSNNPQKALNLQKSFLSQFISLPFDDSCTEVYAKIRQNLTKLGTPIGSNDFQIAAIALANNLTLVTHNIREFSRVEGLRVEDWEEE
jgi:tRNA(fMet)-specific endonuclease VapC